MGLDQELAIYIQSLTFSSITKKHLLANFYANIDIFIIGRQPVIVQIIIASAKEYLIKYIHTYIHKTEI